MSATRLGRWFPPAILIGCLASRVRVRNHFTRLTSTRGLSLSLQPITLSTFTSTNIRHERRISFGGSTSELTVSSLRTYTPSRAGKARGISHTYSTLIQPHTHSLARYTGAHPLDTMLIGITGPICAGKHSTAEYLVQHHGFLRLHLPTASHLQPPPPPSTNHNNHTRESKVNGTHSHHDIRSRDTPQSQSNGSLTVSASASENLARLLPSVTDQKGTRGLTFPDVESLLEFVTKRWREHWVLTDICDEATLETLLRRPFFILLNIDAPVGVRYARFSAR